MYKTKLLAELLAQNPNLNHLVEPSFQGVNRLFVLEFEDDAQRTTILSSKYRIKDYNVVIDGKSFIVQPIKN